MARPITLQRALSLRFALISGIFFVTIAAAILLWVKPRLENRVAADNLILATALAAQVERFLDTPGKILEEAAKSLAAYEGSAGGTSRRPVLETIVNGIDVFQALYVVDTRGRIESVVFDRWSERSPEDYKYLDLSANPVFANARRTGKTVWSEVFLSAVTRAPAVAIATPFSDRTLIGEISLDYLSNFVRQTNSGEGGFALIVDKKGQVLAHPDSAIAKQMINISNFSQFGAIGDKANLSSKTTLDNQEVIASLIRIKRLDWFVLVAKPYEIAIASVNETIRVLIAAGILTILLAIWINEVMSRTLARRFAVLAHNAGQLADGRYDVVEWSETPLIEMNQVGAALRSMTQAIIHREEALRDINMTLESRVALRTAELEKANTELGDSITKHRFAQDELVQSEKLAALGALVAGVAHELNTPIGNAVTIASTLRDKSTAFEREIKEGSLRRSTLNDMTDTITQGSELVLRNLEHAADLVANFKQVAVDQTSAQRRKFDCQAVVEEVLSTLHHLVRNRPFRVTTELARGVEMDSYPGPFGQIINNLFNNALIHGFTGRAEGCITIATRRLGNDRVLFEFSDDGNGIASENLARVFDPFFTTRLGQGGSGLGLHIVHNLVTHMLGGRITVESPATGGTRFNIELPLTAPRAPAVADDSAGGSQ